MSLFTFIVNFEDISQLFLVLHLNVNICLATLPKLKGYFVFVSLITYIFIYAIYKLFIHFTYFTFNLIKIMKNFILKKFEAAGYLHICILQLINFIYWKNL